MLNSFSDDIPGCSTPVMHKPYKKQCNQDNDAIDLAIVDELKARRTQTAMSDEFTSFGNMLSHPLQKMDARKSALTMAKINVLLFEIEYESGGELLQ